MAETTIVTWNATNWITISLMFVILVFAVAVGVKVFSSWNTTDQTAS